MKKAIVIILGISFLGGIIFYVQSHNNKPIYDETVVRRESVTSKINVDAEIAPAVYADISSELPVLVKDVFVEKNDRVTKGQKLLTLDQKSVQAQINNAKLSVERAELTEKKARRHNNWKLLKPEDKKSIKKATEQARQKLNEVYAQASRGNIVSPIDGVVIEQNIKIGEVAQGILMRIINTESLEVNLLIPEVDISKVNKGDKVIITLDAYPNKKIFGTINSIDISSTKKQNNTYFQAKVIVHDWQDIQVLDGMNAEADIIIQQKKNVLVVPRDFAKKDGQGYFVYVNNDIAQKTKLEKKYFKDGLKDDNFIEILSGLKLNDQIFKLK